MCNMRCVPTGGPAAGPVYHTAHLAVQRRQRLARICQLRGTGLQALLQVLDRPAR